MTRRWWIPLAAVALLLLGVGIIVVVSHNRSLIAKARALPETRDPSTTAASASASASDEPRRQRNPNYGVRAGESRGSGNHLASEGSRTDSARPDGTSGSQDATESMTTVGSTSRTPEQQRLYERMLAPMAVAARTTQEYKALARVQSRDPGAGANREALEKHESYQRRQIALHEQLNQAYRDLQVVFPDAVVFHPDGGMTFYNWRVSEAVGGLPDDFDWPSFSD